MKKKTKEEQPISLSSSQKIQEPFIGLSIIPVSSQKIPFKEWKKYQTEIAPIGSWYNHYMNDGYVGVICGKVSGNLECIDIDVKNDPELRIAEDFLDLIPIALKNRLLEQLTPKIGWHIIYRCPEVEIEANQKLALHTDQSVLIETRGEGGYFCTHTTDYRFIQGKFDLETNEIEIPIITAAEREFLLDTARSLTRYFPSAKLSKNGNKFSYSDPAVNDFNNKYPGNELFLKHGWTIVHEDDEKYYLLRPGSNATHSAYYFKDTKLFYCFSSSTVFTTQKPYNNFQILRLLDGNDDYRTSLNLLPNLGYPLTNKKEKITVYDIAEYLNNVGVRRDEFIQDLTLNGDIIEELDYNTLYIKMNLHFDQEVSRTKFENVVKSKFIKALNPIKEFVERNAPRNPSGTFDKWLACITLKNESIDRDVVLHFLKKWYVGMIAQATDGEFPNEFFLALLSTEQGVGKSTLLRRYVLPKELQCYQAEHSLSFDDDFKVIMGQALLIIDDEMDGRTYESSQTFKNVLSQKDMTTRRKYDRRVSTIHRRCSFAGSGNNLNVVREAQNRRIIPIEVKYIDYAALNSVDYTDLFMEAYHLYQKGFKYSYQRGDKKGLEHMYQDYIQKSDVELILDEYIELPNDTDEEQFISTLTIVSRLADLFPQFIRRINPGTIGRLLNDRGFTSTRTGARRISGYIIGSQSKIFAIEVEQDEGTLL